MFKTIEEIGLGNNQLLMIGENLDIVKDILDKDCQTMFKQPVSHYYKLLLEAHPAVPSLGMNCITQWCIRIGTNPEEVLCLNS